MSPIASPSVAAARARRRQATSIKQALRELRSELAQLNHQVSARAELKDVDLDCLDLIAAHGPLTPSAVADRAGLHRATVTGILDRLQRGGWIARERDPDAADRRAVTVRVLPDRSGELYGLLAGMNSRMDDLCAGYTSAELELIAGFLTRTAAAGREAAEELARPAPAAD